MSVTTESFVETIRKSGLVSEDDLQKQLTSLSADVANSNQPTSVAEAMIESGFISKWQAEKLLQGKSKGFFLGKYKLIKLLGRGGMSSVYLAEHTIMKRQCAIKVLPASRIDDSSYLGRFHLEAQAVASLDDPNIVRAYDVDQFNDGKTTIHFLVMEFVEGHNLHDVIMSKGPLAPGTAANFIRQSASGLSHAHKAGLVHRDIKPGNLLLDGNGMVKLLDLGLARFFNDDDEKSLTIANDEKVLGTADFLAPEQALNSHDVDSRADIYSLGCTLYFLLTGHAPFEMGTLAQRLMAHQNQEPPAITTYRQDVPKSLIAIVQKMMAKDPNDRYQTADDVVARLSNWTEESVESGLFPAPDSNIDLTGIESAELSPDSSVNLKDSAKLKSDSSTAKETANIKASSIVTPKPIKKNPGSSKKAQPTPGSGKANPQNAPKSGTGANKPATPRSGMKKAPPPPPPAPVRATPVSSVRTLPPKVGKAVKKLEQDQEDDEITISPVVLVGVPIFVVLLSLLGLVMFLRSGDGKKTRPNATAQQQNQQQNQAQKPAAPQKKDYQVTPNGQYKTIKSALDALKADFAKPQFQGIKEWNILVKAGMKLKEALKIENMQSGFPAKVRIAAQGKSKIVWESPNNEPALSLNNVKGLLIERFNFSVPGKKVGIQISGSCENSQLLQCDVRGFTEAGIKLINAASVQKNPFKMQSLLLSTNNKDALGIQLNGQDKETSAIDIIASRIVGTMKAGIQLNNVNARWILISECVFGKTANGISLNGDKLSFNSLKITNNTFHQCQNSIQLTQQPPGDSKSLKIVRNLFVDPKGPELVVQKNYKEADFQKVLDVGALGLSWNFSTRAKPGKPANGEVDIFKNKGQQGVKGLQFQNNKNLQNIAYMKPKNDSLKVAGPASGLKPYVGAYAPQANPPAKK